MDAIVHDKTDDYDDLTTVTTVESAYKKLGKGYTTYNVAVYVVDDESLAASDYTLESLRGLSKSKAAAAAKAGVMTRAANVTIRVDNKTGEVLEFKIAVATCGAAVQFTGTDADGDTLQRFTRAAVGHLTTDTAFGFYRVRSIAPHIQKSHA